MAIYYWGNGGSSGTGTWNTSSATNWWLDVGRTTAASTAPSSADDVIIDDSSGTGTITCTSAVCNKLTVTASQAIILGAATSTLAVYSDIFLPSGGSFSISTNTLTISLLAASNSSITTNGKVLPNFNINNSSYSLTMNDAFTVGPSYTLTLTSGNINQGIYTLTAGAFALVNNSTAKTFTGDIYITGSNKTVLLTSNDALATVFVNAYLTYNGATGTRTVNTGSTVGNFTNVNVLYGSDIVAITGTTIGDMYFDNAFTGSLANNGRTIHGNITFSPNMTLTFGSLLTTILSGYSGTTTITSNGKMIDFPITITNNSFYAGYVSLAGSLTMGSTRTLTIAGSVPNSPTGFITNDFTVMVGAFVSSTTGLKDIQLGNSTVILLAAGVVWNMGTSSNISFDCGTSNILLTNNTTTARTFAGGDRTYNNLVIHGTTSTSTTTITGTNIFNTLSSVKTVAHTIVFPNVTTTLSNWNISGSSGNLVTLARTGASGTFTLNTTAGRIISNYLNISNGTATPSETWYVGDNSVDAGGNSGWIFSTFKYSLYARLTNTGNIITNNNAIFDEITQLPISIQQSAFYSSGFDEVTTPLGAANFSNTGNVIVDGIFDEVTGIT